MLIEALVSSWRMTVGKTCLYTSRHFHEVLKIQRMVMYSLLKLSRTATEKSERCVCNMPEQHRQPEHLHQNQVQDHEAMRNTKKLVLQAK